DGGVVVEGFEGGEDVVVGGEAELGASAGEEPREGVDGWSGVAFGDDVAVAADGAAALPVGAAGDGGDEEVGRVGEGGTGEDVGGRPWPVDDHGYLPLAEALELVLVVAREVGLRGCDGVALAEVGEVAGGVG